ncbi:MAG: M56 family metallopeptidase [Bacteroidota bacterium]
MISFDLILMLLAFGLTYLLHSTVWLLISTGIQQSGILSTPASINLLWKAALIGAMSTTLLATINHSGKYVFEIPSDESFIAAETAGQNKSLDHEALLVSSQEEANPPEDVQVNQALLPWDSSISAYLFMGIWVLGALCLLTRQIIRHVVFLQKIRDRETIDRSDICQLFQQVKTKADITGKIRLTVSEQLDGPVSIFQQEICLPTYALNSLGEAQIEAMLAHELAHIKRKDGWWMGGLEILHACFFFQPLHRLAYQQLHNSNELLCDAWAVRHSQQPYAMAECLLAVARHKQHSSHAPALISAMAVKHSDLHIRIQQIITSNNMKTSQISPYRLAIMLALFFGLVFWTIPGFGIQEFAYVLPDFGPIPSESVSDPIEEPSSPPSIESGTLVDPSRFQVKAITTPAQFPQADLSFAVSSTSISEYAPIRLDASEISRDSDKESVNNVFRANPFPKEPNKVLIDWENLINRKHSGYRIFRSWSPKKIRELYLRNRQLNSERRIAYDVHGRRKIITDMDEGNSLVFTLIYPSGVRYDTLKNFVRPERDFLKIKKRSRGVKSRWRHRKRLWQKRINEIREWGADGYPPINKRQMIGRLPMNNSVSISTDNNQLDFGFSPKSTYEEATISIYSKGGKLMNTFLDGVMDAGDHRFVWQVEAGPPREYVIHVQIQDQGHSYFWVYPFKLGWPKAG